MTNVLDIPLADRKAELLHWLNEEGRFAPDTGSLLEMLCEKLTVLGAPIARAMANVRTSPSRIPGNIAYLAAWGEYRDPNVEARYRVYIGLSE